MKKTIFEKELNTIWTDGGNPACSGYFDGTGELNNLLLKLYSCGSCSGEQIPFSTDIMGDIKLGSKVKMTIKLEIEEEQNK